jgi:hypothetical protein
MVQGISPRSKALLGMPARRFGPGTLYRIYREFLCETFLAYLFLFRDKPECFVAGRILNKFAKSDRVPLSTFPKLRLKPEPQLIPVFLFILSTGSMKKLAVTRFKHRQGRELASKAAGKHRSRASRRGSNRM